MTLALVFFFVFLSPPSSHAVGAASAQLASPQEAQPQGTTPETDPDTKSSHHSAKPLKTSSAVAPSKRPQNKKKGSEGCKAASASGTGATSSPASSTTSPQAADPPAPKNCPPPKIVVQQGGTSEPSIQLAGGPPGGQASQAKNNVTQMLDSTEGNLKKLSARQLSITEQDAVSQIHQFVDQSKAAVATGDTERARTLAWKAQTLSQDLVNPKQ